MKKYGFVVETTLTSNPTDKVLQAGTVLYLYIFIYLIYVVFFLPSPYFPPPFAVFPVFPPLSQPLQTPEHLAWLLWRLFFLPTVSNTLLSIV